MVAERQEGEGTMKKNEDIAVAEETEEVEEIIDKDEEVLENVDEVEESDDQETKLLAEIEQLKAQVKEEENKYFRALADYDNFKRRTALDKEALQKYKAQSVVTGILPILDNFERAIQVETETEEAKSLMEGMDMIYRSLVDALKSEGLEEIEALDKEFNPNFHQAVMTGNDEEKASGIVLEDMQKGYLLKDRVLRPSMVKVNE